MGSVEGDSGRDMEGETVFGHVERLWCKCKGRNRGVRLWREGMCVREIWVCTCGRRDMVCVCVCVCIETGMGLGVDRVGCVWRERHVYLRV